MSTVRFLAPDTDAYVSSVLKHKKEFTETTGIALDIEILPSDEYFANKISSQLNAETPSDVFMSGPVLLWEHLPAGNVQNLDEFVSSSSSDWDFQDFFPALINSNRWTGKFGDRLGSGPLLEIPVNCESYNLTYVPATLQKYDVAVPKTWSEYFAASKKISDLSNGEIFGFGQRGLDVWHTMYTGYATQVWSYGGSDFNSAGKCTVDSVEVIKATEDFIAALQQSGAPKWTDRRWYELAMDFANGKYGLIVDSDHYVAYFEDAKYSSLVGNFGYALPPKGPTGLIKPNLWTWSLVMNARSQNKSGAWQFIEWASSKKFLTRSAFEGNMNPTRKSTWEAPEFVNLVKPWGDFAKIGRELIENYASVLITPATNYREVADVWVRALRSAYLGEVSVRDALTYAAREMDKKVAR